MLRSHLLLGDRAAINLQGIDKQSISRGSQIVKINHFKTYNHFIIKYLEDKLLANY